MRYPKHSVDYVVNLETLHEMEEVVPMTLHERECVRSWVKSGHPLETNPWNYSSGDGCLLDYLQAFRIHYGFPCQFSRYSFCDSYYVWDDKRKVLTEQYY